jgi:hypothetical protein
MSQPLRQPGLPIIDKDKLRALLLIDDDDSGCVSNSHFCA